jgi:hypothetical protein
MSIDVARLQARLLASKSAESKGEILIQLLHFWEDANWPDNIALAKTLLSTIDESVLSIDLRCAMAYGLIKRKRLQDALPLLENAERQAADLEPSLLSDKSRAHIQ